jgi:inosine-uridine nucleoside N-ribohydrolase
VADECTCIALQDGQVDLALSQSCAMKVDLQQAATAGYTTSQHCYNWQQPTPCSCCVEKGK